MTTAPYTTDRIIHALREVTEIYWGETCQRMDWHEHIGGACWEQVALEWLYPDGPPMAIKAEDVPAVLREWLGDMIQRDMDQAESPRLYAVSRPWVGRAIDDALRYTDIVYRARGIQ